MKFKQQKHTRVSKYGKVFTAGSAAGDAINKNNAGREKLISKLRKKYEASLRKMTRMRTNPVTFEKHTQAARTRNRIAEYFAAKHGDLKPLGMHFAAATNKVKLLKGNPQQQKEALASLKRRFMQR